MVWNLFEQYDEIFAKNDRDIGLAKDINHKIDMGSHQAINLRPFWRSRAAKAIAELEIQKLIEGGLLVKSHNQCASPILIVKKKDVTNRFVINYWRLNTITKKDSYLLPRIDNAIDKLGGAQFFSAIDLISRYWQINLPEED